ncbi:MAG TPA: hypothetical protein VFY10_16860 [Dehalococcoidia bacterium]|nr:hypothetical protein [Dehalococcoidia bacterium]
MAEIDVALTYACPAGATVEVIVAYPGQDPETKPASPPIEWRAPVSGDPQPITVGVGGDGPPTVTQSITPEPTAPPAPVATASGCGFTGPLQIGPTTTLGDLSASLVVSLPRPGDYITMPTGTPGSRDIPAALTICNLQTNASIKISLDGQELGRSAADAVGNAILDRLLAGAKVAPGYRYPPQTPIIPPTTGDAGLK